MIPGCNFGDDAHAFLRVCEVGGKKVEALFGWVDGGGLGERGLSGWDAWDVSIVWSNLDLFQCCFEPLDVSCNDHDMGTFLCEQFCKALSHALRASSDDDRLLRT